MEKRTHSLLHYPYYPVNPIASIPAYFFCFLFYFLKKKSYQLLIIPKGNQGVKYYYQNAEEKNKYYLIIKSRNEILLQISGPKGMFSCKDKENARLVLIWPHWVVSATWGCTKEKAGSFMNAFEACRSQKIIHAILLQKKMWLRGSVHKPCFERGKTIQNKPISVNRYCLD